MVRYEHDGSATVLADSFEGKRLNSPNDIVVHPNGSVWFTDPPYGTRAPGGYEGTPSGAFPEERRLSSRPTTASAVEQMVDEIESLNGLCFNRDYTRMYIVNTARRTISGCTT